MDFGVLNVIDLITAAMKFILEMMQMMKMMLESDHDVACRQSHCDSIQTGSFNENDTNIDGFHQVRGRHPSGPQAQPSFR